MVLLLIAVLLAAAATLLRYLPRNKRPLLKLTPRIPAVVLMCATFLEFWRIMALNGLISVSLAAVLSIAEADDAKQPGDLRIQ